MYRAGPVPLGTGRTGPVPTGSVNPGRGGLDGECGQRGEERRGWREEELEAAGEE
jgi:hypothetical protein